MGRFIAIFESKPEAAELRKQFHAAHLAYLAANPAITLAGSVHELAEEAAWGGVWLINGVSAEEARRLCEEDPFFIEGTRKSYRLLRYETPPMHEHIFNH